MLSLHDKVFREDVGSVRRLEHAVLTVELQVPSDDVDTSRNVIKDEQLDEVLNSRGEDVLDPDLRTRVHSEVDG